MAIRDRVATGSVLLPLLIAFAPGLSAAQPPVREVRTTFAASLNTLGVQQSLQISWRTPRAALGVEPSLTPAMVRAGAWVEVTSVPLLVLRAGAESSAFFGTFHSLMSFDRRDEAFDTDSRTARGPGRAATAHRLFVRPTLRLRAGPVVALSSLDVERWYASVDGPYFYEPTRDTLLASHGDTVTHWSTMVLHETTRPSGATLYLGVLHSLQRVDRSDLNGIQRLGAIATISAAGTWWKLTRPTAAMLVAHYLDDPSKAGTWTAGIQVGVSVR